MRYKYLKRRKGACRCLLHRGTGWPLPLLTGHLLTGMPVES